MIFFIKELYFDIKDFILHKYRKIQTFWWNIKNIIRWIPVLWNNFDFDFTYLLEVMEYKLQRLYEGIDHYQNHLYYKKDLFWINIAKTLINRIREDYYVDEMYLYYSSDWDINFTPTNIIDNLDEYFNKNKNLYKYVIEKYPEIERFSIACIMVTEKHKKAKNLLFKILNEHIEEWWD